MYGRISQNLASAVCENRVNPKSGTVKAAALTKDFRRCIRGPADACNGARVVLLHSPYICSAHTLAAPKSFHLAREVPWLTNMHTDSLALSFNHTYGNP